MSSHYSLEDYAALKGLPESTVGNAIISGHLPVRFDEMGYPCLFLVTTSVLLQLPTMEDAMAANTYKEWASVYRELGLEPRPVKPGGKATKVQGWSKPDSEFDPAELISWDDKFANYGIGLRMGTPLPGGGSLGALDIDHNNYVRPIEAVLGKTVSGRFGSKGAVIFVRVIGNLKNNKFKSKNETMAKHGAVVECLFNKTFCVIPPTIHPTTDQPYHWIGTPLHEVNFDLLPRIGE